MMFDRCRTLTTIYGGVGWNVDNVIDDGWDMFYGCRSLVGGKGTTYDEEQTDYTYAHIDGGAENPGYFTAILATDAKSALIERSTPTSAYTLSGQQVANGYKGLVIENGRKVMMK